ncbi:hypothetical protein Sfr7A_16020 [Streptomyces xinghaiensis]|uniref:Uncharacterized protein n=1 Tax=Streptomyces xinghaiensis TaxID=1038928 RepID=A0A420V560_9ACTN|nr:hypothetical protein Sfr7A_16020 [Streptomyces xinghaiensis]RKM96582.1 hypothetical protein SFRA_011090 [Streptomyces xinghaiensis]RNC74266.1 hypothetical protein DC095_011055 [Streptomyces xinghaiensis]
MGRMPEYARRCDSRLPGPDVDGRSGRAAFRPPGRRCRTPPRTGSPRGLGCRGSGLLGRAVAVPRLLLDALVAGRATPGSPGQNGLAGPEPGPSTPAR